MKASTAMRTSKAVKASTKLFWAFCIANLAVLVVVAVIVGTSIG